MKYTSDRRSPVTSSSAERAALVKCALADGCEKHGDCPKPEEWETNSGTWFGCGDKPEALQLRASSIGMSAWMAYAIHQSLRESGRSKTRLE